MSEPRPQPSGAQQALERAEGLLERLESARARLEATDDPEAAIDVLAELAEIAKEVEGEIDRARRQAEAEPGGRADA